MKRQELKTLLQNVDNAGDIIDRIMEINGEDIENAKKSAGTDTQSLTAENEKLKAQLKAYEKGGEKYIDPAEIERLKKFETDTKATQKRTAAENAVKEMLTRNKVLPGYIKLMLKNLNVDEVQLDDKGKITADYEKKYIADFKADCPDGFEQPSNGTGGAPAHGNGGDSNGKGGGADGFEDLRAIK